MNHQELEILTEAVLGRLFVPIEASGRHVHITEKQAEVLFGHRLTPKRPLSQPGQFVCASETENGVYNPQNIYNMRPTDVHYDIADWAIAGNRLRDVAESLWFYNPFSANCRPNFPSNVGYLQTRIGDHCFYNPTDAYYKT